MTLSVLLLLLAFIAFLLATIGWPATRINLIALGLALWVLSILVGAGHISVG